MEASTAIDHDKSEVMRMAKRPELDQNFFRLWEDSRREQLENHATQPADIGESLKSVVDNLPQTLESLRARYLRDRNPVLVWIAIQNIELATRYQGSAVAFPPRVLAYLFTAAAGIGGMAASWPAESSDPNAMVEGSSFNKAEQRTGFAMIALGFKPSRGSNPLLTSYRNYKNSLVLREVAKSVQSGCSEREAAEKINDASLRSVHHKSQKLRRMRSK